MSIQSELEQLLAQINESEFAHSEGEAELEYLLEQIDREVYEALPSRRQPLPQPIIPGPPPVQMPNPALDLKPLCLKPPKITSYICYSYGPGEISTSRTAAGHLDPDVVVQPPLAVLKAPLSSRSPRVECGFLIIRDFGVDWRHVKLVARKEPLFKDLLNYFDANKNLTFRILGYSDCVGVERNNAFLRRGRARNIFKLLGSSARSRVLEVIAASPHTYLTDNSTVAARAQNRSVVIEFYVTQTV